MEGTTGPETRIQGQYRDEKTNGVEKTADLAQQNPFLSLRNIMSLPADILLQIFDLVEPEYVKEFFLYWQPTRSLVIERYYSRELHCIVSPLGRQQHVCVNNGPSNAIYDLFYYGEIDDFLDANPEIVPEKLLFVTGSDFYSLYDLFKRFRTRFLKSASIEIVMEACKYSVEDLKFILSFPNISRLQFGRFKFKALRPVFEQCFPDLKHLSVIQFLAHDVQDWTGFPFPPHLKSLDCSWNPTSSVLGMPLNENLQELYLNHMNVTDTLVVELLNNVPSDLKVLMLSYNPITEFPCSLIPEALEKLDLSHNRIKALVSNGDSPTVFNSDKLSALNLGFNLLSDSSLASLKHKLWPTALRALNLSQNRISDIYLLNNLPENLESLDLFDNDIQFRTENHIIIPFKFPPSLEYLVLDDNRNLISNFQHSRATHNQIIFPDSLKELNLMNCGIRTLRHFKLSASIRHLRLSSNPIQSEHETLDETP